MTDKQITLRTIYKECIDEIHEYCIEQNLKADWTACEILKIMNKHFDRILGYDR